LGADIVTPEKRSESGSFAGCYLNYKTDEGEVILAKIASGSSYEQAQRSMQQENPLWSFEQTRKAAVATWSQTLNKIEVKGGTEKQRRIFYSCLYHAFASPTMVVRKGDEFLGLDKKLHVAEHDRYDAVPYWDTGRNQVVLLTLLDPERKQNILRSQFDRAAESGWMETSFHGDHSVAMFLGDWERGLQFDYEGVYRYLYKNATDPRGPREKLAEYLEKGWIHDLECENPSPPYEGGNAGVSKTLEYCYDDYCLSLYAARLGKEADSRMFAERAKNYRNVWDASTGFMRGRREDGAWLAPFFPEEPYYNYMFKEASSWQMSWFVPHDVKGLIQMMGGRQAFIAKLDTFFTMPYKPKAIARDITGMIGQYCHGNEPDHQVPFYYNWAGAPWKTQELVRKILHLMYGSDGDGLGLAGMDDQGENCSWYVMNAMGFYTVDPARAEYVIGSPIFDEITIHMGNGKDFNIVARNNSETNVYIQSAELNGKPLEKPWFTHAAIADGGRLVLNMGSQPNKKWGCSAEAAPHSMSD
jgi:predicted alpha-1,2-mannosidase